MCSLNICSIGCVWGHRLYNNIYVTWHLGQIRLPRDSIVCLWWMIYVLFAGRIFTVLSEFLFCAVNDDSNKNHFVIWQKMLCKPDCFMLYFNKFWAHHWWYKICHGICDIEKLSIFSFNLGYWGISIYKYINCLILSFDKTFWFDLLL